MRHYSWFSLDGLTHRLQSHALVVFLQSVQKMHFVINLLWSSFKKCKDNRICNVHICVQMELNCDNIYTVISENWYIKTYWNHFECKIPSLCWVEQTEERITVIKVMYTADHFVNLSKLDSSRSQLYVSDVVYSVFLSLPFSYYLISFLCHVMSLSKKVFYFYRLSYPLYCINHLWTFCRTQTFACQNKSVLQVLFIVLW